MNDPLPGKCSQTPACHACSQLEGKLCCLTGGAEHAVLHLLYARFWHKVLYDLGVVSTKEPFRRLVSQGMILGEVGGSKCGYR